MSDNRHTVKRKALLTRAELKRKTIVYHLTKVE